VAVAHKSPAIPFVLAGLLGFAAAAAWIYAVKSSGPAVFVALGWIAFTSAIASGWVGGVRLYRNRASGDTSSRDDRGRPPHDAHPST